MRKVQGPHLWRRLPGHGLPELGDAEHWRHKQSRNAGTEALHASSVECRAATCYIIPVQCSRGQRAGRHPGTWQQDSWMRKVQGPHLWRRLPGHGLPELGDAEHWRHKQSRNAGTEALHASSVECRAATCHIIPVQCSRGQRAGRHPGTWRQDSWMRKVQGPHLWRCLPGHRLPELGDAEHWRHKQSRNASAEGILRTLPGELSLSCTSIDRAPDAPRTHRKSYCCRTPTSMTSLRDVCGWSSVQRSG